VYSGFQNSIIQCYSNYTSILADTKDIVVNFPEELFKNVRLMTSLVSINLMFPLFDLVRCKPCLPAFCSALEFQKVCRYSSAEYG
jgi:hypothetical protein